MASLSPYPPVVSALYSMAHCETDSEAVLSNSDCNDTAWTVASNQSGHLESSRHGNASGDAMQEDHHDGVDSQSICSVESEYSLDYEYLGPREPTYRNQNDADSDASELSDPDNEDGSLRRTGFDMWDEDPYSTNDYTWESNDMRLSLFISQRHRQLRSVNTPWRNSSFWHKKKGWPKQLPQSCSTTNHDQSANALCLVLGDYGFLERLYAVYRDRIVECGPNTGCQHTPSTDPWPPILTNTTRDAPGLHNSCGASASNIDIHSSNNDNNNSNNNNNGSCSGSSGSSNTPWKGRSPRSYDTLTWIDSHHYPANTSAHGSNSSDSSSSVGSVNSQDRQPPSSSTKFRETHLAVSLRETHPCTTPSAPSPSSATPVSCIAKFVPFTKYIKRADFPRVSSQDAYLKLGFEPMCLAHQFGYMAIGGLEGEFELYCCMDHARPVRLWSTQFKSRHNVQLMTNAIQIVRWKTSIDPQPPTYQHMLIACVNEAGILIYKLPSHSQCRSFAKSGHRDSKVKRVELHTHLHCFDQMPINDAKVSPDGQTMICVGDDAFVYLVDVQRSAAGDIVFQTPVKLRVPSHVLASSDHPADTPYSSQYIAWSKSSTYFAHTSDTHTKVLVWNRNTRQVILAIDGGGYTYAVAFHPILEGVLTFTNRYGYFHTVNLVEAVDSSTKQWVNVMDSARRVPEEGDDVLVHQEITMVAFRGERDRRLRILAKINGIQWSRDGRYLYVATKKRVLAYEFVGMTRVQTLFDLAGNRVREHLDLMQTHTPVSPYTHKRKRSTQSSSTAAHWYDHWNSLPRHVQSRVLSQTQLASHW